MMICGGALSSSVRHSSLVWRTDRLPLRSVAKERSQHRRPELVRPDAFEHERRPEPFGLLVKDRIVDVGGDDGCELRLQ